MVSKCVIYDQSRWSSNNDYTTSKRYHTNRNQEDNDYAHHLTILQTVHMVTTDRSPSLPTLSLPLPRPPRRHYTNRVASERILVKSPDFLWLMRCSRSRITFGIGT